MHPGASAKMLHKVSSTYTLRNLTILGLKMPKVSLRGSAPHPARAPAPDPGWGSAPDPSWGSCPRPPSCHHHACMIPRDRRRPGRPSRLPPPTPPEPPALADPAHPARPTHPAMSAQRATIYVLLYRYGSLLCRVRGARRAVADRTRRAGVASLAKARTGYHSVGGKKCAQHAGGPIRPLF